MTIHRYDIECFEEKGHTANEHDCQESDDRQLEFGPPDDGQFRVEAVLFFATATGHPTSVHGRLRAQVSIEVPRLQKFIISEIDKITFVEKDGTVGIT